jgi:hypothetical protein
MELHVPDFDVLIRAAKVRACLDDAAEGGLNERLHWMHWIAERLFHTGPEEQWHRACFNEEHLAWCCRQAGFAEIQRITAERGSDHGLVNLGITAVKPLAQGSAQAPRVVQSAGIALEPTSTGAPLLDARLAGPLPAFVPGAEDLPPCHSRREFDAKEHTFFCAHPHVHLAGQLASADICRQCDRWQAPAPDEFRPYTNHAGVIRIGHCWYLGDGVGLRGCDTCRGRVTTKVFACRHPAHESTTIQECLRCPDYEPRLSVGEVTSWAVGVTTAPRRQTTLPRTLASLSGAGWGEIRIFAEPDSPVPTSVAGVEITVTNRESIVGAWPNWYLGLAELYQREPLADAFLMVQDDVVFCRNLRPLLETLLWPAERLAVVSLYNPRPSSDPAESWAFEALPAHEGLPGALALAFPNHSARLLLADAQCLLHRRRGPSQALKLIDTVVGQWADRAALPALAVWPSLSQHIGQTSTIWPESEDRIVREAISFVGEGFDPLASQAPTNGILPAAGRETAVDESRQKSFRSSAPFPRASLAALPAALDSSPVAAATSSPQASVSLEI